MSGVTQSSFDVRSAAYHLIGATVNRLAMIDQCADDMAVRLYWRANARQWWLKPLTWPLSEKLKFLTAAAKNISDLATVKDELLSACSQADCIHRERHSIIHGMASGITTTSITFTRTKIKDSRLLGGSVTLSLADFARFTEEVRGTTERFHNLQAAIADLWPGDPHGEA